MEPLLYFFKDSFTWVENLLYIFKGGVKVVLEVLNKRIK